MRTAAGYASVSPGRLLRAVVRDVPAIARLLGEICGIAEVPPTGAYDFGRAPSLALCHIAAHRLGEAGTFSRQRLGPPLLGFMHPKLAGRVLGAVPWLV